MQNQTINRIASFDLVRGVAMVFIIFFHTSIYNYANIHKIDFSDPPIFIVLMSFMALWGGIFIVYSAVINTILLAGRLKNSFTFRHVSYLLVAAGVYLIVHYLLVYVFGRWNNDFINNRPDMTFVAASLRNGSITLPNITKLFEGSSLSTISINLIVVSLMTHFALKNKIQKKMRNYLLFGLSGLFIILFSFVRVPLHQAFHDTVVNGSYFQAVIFGFVLANPYPLLPYLAYGLFGSMLGLAVFYNETGFIKKVITPLSLILIVYGLYGMGRFEKSISTPDYFWYFKTHFELGLFILLFVFTALVLTKSAFIERRLKLFKWFSRVSLTIYLFETSLSELLRKVVFIFVPGWNETINSTFIFGSFNVIVWCVILYLWSRINFKYSFEYFFVLFFGKVGKRSTKLLQLDR